MNSNSDISIGSNNSLKPHSQSFNLKNIFLDQIKSRTKNVRGIHKSNRLYEHQRKKGDFKYFEKYVHNYFIHFYKNSKNDFNIRMIDDILNNESTHLVAEFKDYLIMGDITEFLQKAYNIQECQKYLPKIYEYYNSCSVIFPNYVNLHESKYIYKNIRKKQKVIDNQQEQEEKQEKIKKGNIKLENNDVFFTTKTFNSILDQTNTSNLKLFFGVNDKIDANETPNNIVAKLEKAENEANKRKINLVKNNRNSKNMNNIMEDNNTTNNIKVNNNNSNKNIFNNSKIYNKNKYINQRNKSNNNDIHYLTGAKKKNNIKLNHNHINTNINSNSNINANFEKTNKLQINNYLSKKPYGSQNQTIIKRESTQKNYIKSNSNANDTENEINGKNNYSSYYSTNIINTKKQEIKKFLIDNSRNKQHQIYFRNINNSNKYIKKQLINSLFPSKSVLKKLFNNYDNNNNNNSVLKHNSFNIINKKSTGKNITENNQALNPTGFTSSPSSITIQANPFRNKNNYNINININIKESNSTRNIINNKLNNNNKSKEKLNLKNMQDKFKRKLNQNSHNQNAIDFNSNTITTSVTSKASSNKEKIKYIHTNKNFVYNKAQMINNYSNYNKCSNFRTLGNNSPNKGNNNNQNRNFNIINNINNTNNNNNYMIKNVNIHKINSTSNIQKPMNMNININMNNNNKNKIYFNDGSCTNIIHNKVYSKTPLSLELETIKVTKKKRTIYPKTKTYSNVNNKHNQDIYKNFNSNIINSVNNNANTLTDKNYYIDSINHTSLNSNNYVNDEITSNSLSPNYNNNNYISNAKKNFFLDELYRKKNNILPINKEINNININLNGHNQPKGSLTSRTSNNASKKKYKRNNGVQEINICNSENKLITNNTNNKGKINKKNNNNLISRNEGNPVKIKKMYDSIKTNKNIANNKNTGYLSARKK